MKISEAWAIFRNISNDGTPDLEKGRAIQIVMDAATHNSITKNDMLRVIRWLWNMVFEEATGSDGENPVKWVWADDVYLRCGNCGQKAPVTTQYQDEPETTATAFCPHCGKRMEGIGNAAD